MSQYFLDSDRYRVTFGYDRTLGSFWLIIEAKNPDQQQENELLFNNLLHWPGILMTINDLKYVLERFNERIPEADLYRLYQEAKNFGYFSKLNLDDFCSCTTPYEKTRQNYWQSISRFFVKKIDRFYCHG